MSDYKFKVEDKVKVESLDFWSVENMKSYIGKIGTVVFKEKDEDKKCNAYLIQYDNEHYLDIIESIHQLLPFFIYRTPFFCGDGRADVRAICRYFRYNLNVFEFNSELITVPLKSGIVL